MGYYITQQDQDFCIKKKNRSAALAAIKTLSDRRSYSWVHRNDVRKSSTFEMAMHAWRWEVHLNKQGDATSIYFEGQKHGDDAILFAAIAPYVESGSYIEMRGEDGEMWRWVFEDKLFAEREAAIDWTPQQKTTAESYSPMVTLTREEARLLTDLLEDHQARQWDVLDESPEKRKLVKALEFKARNINAWYRNH